MDRDVSNARPGRDLFDVLPWTQRAPDIAFWKFYENCGKRVGNGLEILQREQRVPVADGNRVEVLQTLECAVF